VLKWQEELSNISINIDRTTDSHSVVRRL